MRHIGAYSYATQSSLSPYSHGATEAANALSGEAPKGYAFHTSLEFEPWWLVDLGKEYPVTQIRLFKRLGYEDKYDKEDFKVSLSGNLEKWTCLDNDKAEVTGSQFIFSTRPINSRFIKIRSRSSALYLQKIEIFEDEEIIPFRGALIHLDRYSRAYRAYLEKGNYELPEINWAHRLVNPGDRILELGASIGAISCAICCAFPGIEYTAVEPNSEVYKALQLNHALNQSNCTLINAAVSSCSSKSVEFFTSENFLSSSLIRRNNSSSSILVESISFDKLIATYNPSLLICDCEGAEYDIFYNSSRFDDIERIIIEMHPGEGNVIELYDKIASLGYDPLTKKPSSNMLTVAAFKKQVL